MTDPTPRPDPVTMSSDGLKAPEQPARAVAPLEMLFREAGWQLDGVTFGESAAGAGTGGGVDSAVEAATNHLEVQPHSVPASVPTEFDHTTAETAVIVAASPTAIIPGRSVDPPPVAVPSIQAPATVARLNVPNDSEPDRFAVRLAAPSREAPQNSGAAELNLERPNPASVKRATAGAARDRLQPFAERIFEQVKQNPAAAVVLVIVLLALGLVRLVGSGEGGEVADLVAVSGTVLVDGQPLENGVISFVSTHGGRTVAAKITNGRYSLPREAGPMLGPQKVSVNAFRTIDETDAAAAPATTAAGSQMSEAVPADASSGRAGEAVQFLPERYNAQTTLRVDLRSTVNSAVSFELQAD